MGMALITVCALMKGVDGAIPALFVASLLSWEVSCAHFNPAVTFGSIIFSSIQDGDLRKKFTEGVVIMVNQFCGGLFGILLTLMSSYINNVNDNQRD